MAINTSYAAFHKRSIEQREEFWGNEAKRIDWHKPFDTVLDYSNPPFSRWFEGGELNLCHNAIDRHLESRGEQKALICNSTETGAERVYTYRELHAEVQRMAAVLRSLGVGDGDRVLIYLPMVHEAIFAMLATVRLGAIHSVVFGGFASHSLAARIDDARPKVLIAADAGMGAGKVIAYRTLLREALKLTANKPKNVLIVDRGLDASGPISDHDSDYATLRGQHLDAQVPCEWVESMHPSYILYTSGTTGKPTGVQRDTGGHAVALAASMEYVYDARPDETYFATSDIGWMVGHSYIVYGPLIHGMATVVYEATPVRPDPGIWWKIVQDHRVSVMFTAPTAVRVLKKQDPEYLKKYDISSLRHLFLAGEPLDEPTARWISGGVVCIEPPLPPSCMSTVWGQDGRFVETYFTSFGDRLIYTTFDWGVRDDDGYYFILGRTDDVINVAGHRLGTREIEEAVASHPAVAEVAVVGIADQLKGQTPSAFVVVKDPARVATQELRETLEKEILGVVNNLLGAIGRPSRVSFVAQLPKTRSGKVLRRSIQAIAEARDPGDLTSLDDPAGLDLIRVAVAESAAKRKAEA